MFGQIIDLLVKQEDERRKVSFLLIKILFTATITANLYECLFGNYTIISVTDTKAIFDFLIHGTSIVCFSLFYFVWTISYGFTSFLLSTTGIWLSNKLYDVFSQIINNPEQLASSFSKDKFLLKATRFYFRFLNSIDIVEIEDRSIKPGANFYKFYDYLLDIEENKKTVSRIEFSDTISLIIQFSIIYNLLELNFLSTYRWIFIVVIIIITVTIFFSIFGYVFSTLIDLKHTRVLKLMKKIDPDYKKEVLNENESENQK